MNNYRFIIVLYILFAAPAAIAASALTPEDILTDVRLHYPKILAAQAELDAKRAKVQAANGAFDASLESDISSRAVGFYSGRYIDSKIVKPLAPYNANIYGGYRVSDGAFPEYEGMDATNSGGEFNIGGSMSLLRDRLIDSRRAGVRKTELAADISALELTLTRLNVHQQALLTYWRWVSAGQYLTVLKDMNRFARTREKGLKERYKRGDIAKILLTEARQNVIKTESRLVEQRRVLDSEANNLSLFYRDDDGSPIVPDVTILPKKFASIRPVTDKDDIAAAIRANPALTVMYRKIALEQQEVRLGENALLPKADISMELSEDLGSGSRTRDETEAKIGINFSFPLQRRTGIGSIRSAQANIRRLEHEAALKEEQLRQTLNNRLIALDAYAKDIELTAEEMTLARRMQQAETQRFKRGDSDFFLVNVRDEMLANARIKHILAQLKYRITLTDIHALTLNTAALMADG